MKHSLLLSALVWIAPPAIAQTSVLLESPVKITVHVRNVSGTDANTPVSAMDLAIHQGSHEFRLTVMQRGDSAGALAAQKARTGWKDGYLFIRDDCLGANEEKRAWRCVVDQVFTFVDSREGKRLVHLGDVFAGDDCLDEARLACALYQGAFTDIYDALENNALVSHAESPALLLETQAADGQFTVDLDATWGHNQERFGAGERCLEAGAAERTSACVDGITPRRAYLFNSALATYTRRLEQLMRVRAFARTALCEGRSDSDCSEVLRLSALVLAGIRPGEKPRSRGNVKSVLLSKSK
jgi:hypothetical protein